VDIDEFWLLVERARVDAAAGGEVPTGKMVGAALTERLADLPAARIVEFDRRLAVTLRRAHQWAICAAAFVIWQHISDDSLRDFEAGMIGLGREVFERVVADPDDLTDHPSVQAIAAGRLDRYALNGELVLYAASRAYERRTDDPDDFWEAVDAEPLPTDGDRRQSAEGWDGRFGGVSDETQIPRRLPRLHALFAAAH
jgi:hypothetical protein